MSESVEQAALRRSLETEWTGRARREATAILAGCGMYNGDYIPREAQYPTVVTLLAIAWLQGNICGSHETLSNAERAFDRLRDAL